MHVVIPIVLAAIALSSVATWFFLSGGSVLFLNDRFYPQPALTGISKIELFNGGRGIGYGKTIGITNPSEISAITTIINRYREDWFDATHYPVFGTDIHLKFFGQNHQEVGSLAIGSGGWDKETSLLDGTTIELYNQMGVSKFSSSASESAFYEICKAIGARFYDSACGS